MDWGLLLTLIIQVASIAYFAGVIKANQEHQKDNAKTLKEDFNNFISELKNEFKEKLAEVKNSFKEDFQRLERKQDKHNGVIERTYSIEKEVSVIKEQEKVQNHRIEDLEELQHERIRKRD